MKKIEITPGDKLDEVVDMLIEADIRGEQVYVEFNGHKLYSNGITMDSAYKEVLGFTKQEFEQIQNRNQREQKYAQMVNSTRTPGQDVIIAMPTVIEGLKFIAENKTLNQKELIKGLLDLGCNFTFEDIKKQFPNGGKVYEGMKKGEISSGASVIANVRDSEFGREYCNENFLSLDDDTSIYHFIRTVTGDQNYTKNNLNKNYNEVDRYINIFDLKKFINSTRITCQVFQERGYKPSSVAVCEYLRTGNLAVFTETNDARKNMEDVDFDSLTLSIKLMLINGAISWLQNPGYCRVWDNEIPSLIIKFAREKLNKYDDIEEDIDDSFDYLYRYIIRQNKYGEYIVPTLIDGLTRYSSTKSYSEETEELISILEDTKLDLIEQDKKLKR